MTDQEWYDYGQKHCGIEVGDKVKILREAENKELGWEFCWTPAMDSQVGRILMVKEERGKKGFRLMDGYSYPFFVLELVEKAKAKLELPSKILNIIDNRDFGCAKESVVELVQEILKHVKEERR